MPAQDTKHAHHLWDRLRHRFRKKQISLIMLLSVSLLNAISAADPAQYCEVETASITLNPETASSEQISIVDDIVLDDYFHATSTVREIACCQDPNEGQFYSGFKIYVSDSYFYGSTIEAPCFGYNCDSCESSYILGPEQWIDTILFSLKNNKLVQIDAGIRQPQQLSNQFRICSLDSPDQSAFAIAAEFPIVGFSGSVDPTNRQWNKIRAHQQACFLFEGSFQLSQPPDIEIKIEENNPQGWINNNYFYLTDYYIQLGTTSVDFQVIGSSIMDARSGSEYPNAVIVETDIEGSTEYSVELRQERGNFNSVFTEPYATMLYYTLQISYAAGPFIGTVQATVAGELNVYYLDDVVGGDCISLVEDPTLQSAHDELVVSKGVKDKLDNFANNRELSHVTVCKNATIDLLTGIQLYFSNEDFSYPSECYGSNCEDNCQSRSHSFAFGDGFVLVMWYDQTLPTPKQSIHAIYREWEGQYRDLYTDAVYPTLPDLTQENLNFPDTPKSYVFVDMGVNQLVDMYATHFEGANGSLTNIGFYGNQCYYLPKRLVKGSEYDQQGFPQIPFAYTEVQFDGGPVTSSLSWYLEWAQQEQSSQRRLQSALVEEPSTQLVEVNIASVTSTYPDFFELKYLPIPHRSADGFLSVIGQYKFIAETSDEFYIQYPGRLYAAFIEADVASSYLNYPIYSYPELFKVEPPICLFEAQQTIPQANYTVSDPNGVVLDYYFDCDSDNVNTFQFLVDTLSDGLELSTVTLNQLAVTNSSVSYQFYTADPSLVGAILDVQLIIIALDEGGEVLADYSKTIAQINITAQPPNPSDLCPVTQFLDFQKIKPMRAYLNDTENVTQSIEPFQNQASLDVGNETFCGDVNYEFVLLSNKSEPRFISIVNEQIQLSSVNISEEADFELELVVYLQNYTEVSLVLDLTVEFQSRPVEEGTNQTAVDEIINTPPYFVGFEDFLTEAELPSWTLKVGQQGDYQLPETADREDDQVTVSIQPGSPAFIDCACVLFDTQSRTVRVTPSEALAGTATTIQVFLKDQFIETYYFFVLTVSNAPFQKPAEPEVSQKEQLQEAFPIQQKFPGVIVPDEFIEPEQVKLPQGSCVPTVRRISRDGMVQVAFNKKLELIELTPDLTNVIKQSGSIQIQLLSRSPFQSELSFSWSITSFSEYQIDINVEFENPAFISSDSEPDVLYLKFVETDSFLRCADQYYDGHTVSINDILQRLEAKKAPVEDNSERFKNVGRRLQVTSEDTVPPQYQIKFEMPPQLNSNETETIEQVAEAAESAGKTLVFSSMAVAAIFKFSMQNLWGGINAVQLIAHLPMNNVVFPVNAYYCFDVMVSVVSFDLYAPTDYYDFGFTETDPYSANFEWLGYETSNFIECLGSIILFFLVLVLKDLLTPLIQLVEFCLYRLGKSICCCKRGKTCCKRLRNSIVQTKDSFIASWITFFLEVYFELLISMMVGLRLNRILDGSGEDKTSSDKVALGLTWFMTPFIILFPVFVTWFTVYKSRQLSQLRKRKRRIGQYKKLREFYLHLELESSDSALSKFVFGDNVPNIKASLELLRRRTIDLDKTLDYQRRNTILNSGSKVEDYEQSDQKFNHKPPESADNSLLADKSGKEQAEGGEQSADHIDSNEEQKPPIGGQLMFAEREPALTIKEINPQLIPNLDLQKSKSQPKAVKFDVREQSSPQDNMFASLPDNKNENSVPDSESYDEAFQQRSQTISRLKTNDLAMMIARENSNTMRNEDTIEDDFLKYTPLWEGLAVYKTVSFAFYEVFMLRRILFVLAAYYLYDYPWIQVLSYLVQSKCMLAFLVKAHPFEDDFKNNLEIFNEWIVMVVGYHQVILTGFQLSTESRNRVGTSMIIFICLLVAVNILLLIGQMLLKLRLNCIRCYNLRVKRRVKPRQPKGKDNLADQSVHLSSIRVSIEGEKSYSNSLQSQNSERKKSSQADLPELSSESIDFDRANKKYGPLTSAVQEKSQKLPVSTLLDADPLILHTQSSAQPSSRSFSEIASERSGMIATKMDDLERSKVILDAIDKDCYVEVNDEKAHNINTLQVPKR